MVQVVAPHPHEVELQHIEARVGKVQPYPKGQGTEVLQETRQPQTFYRVSQLVECQNTDQQHGLVEEAEEKVEVQHVAAQGCEARPPHQEDKQQQEAVQ